MSVNFPFKFNKIYICYKLIKDGWEKGRGRGGDGDGDGDANSKRGGDNDNDDEGGEGGGWMVEANTKIKGHDTRAMIDMVW